MNEENDKLQGFKRNDFEDRQDLAGEHKFSDLGQLIFLISFTIVWVLDSFIFRFSTFLIQYIPNYVRGILACVTLLIAGYIAYKAHNQVFDEVRDSPEVISKGVFAYFRHPMYLGAILLYVGMIISTLSLISLGFWIPVIIFYNYIASYEEKILTQNFGEEYTKYKKEVSKWIPWKKLFRRKKEKKEN